MLTTSSLVISSASVEMRLFSTLTVLVGDMKVISNVIGLAAASFHKFMWGLTWSNSRIVGQLNKKQKYWWSMMVVMMAVVSVKRICSVCDCREH